MAEKPGPHLMPSDDMWGVFYLEGRTDKDTAPDAPEEQQLCALWNAAPALLAACEALCDTTRQSDGRPMRACLATARAAIARARGES